LVGKLRLRGYRFKNGLGGSALQTAAFTLGEASPDTESFIVGEGILQTLLPHITGEADSLGFTSGSPFLREKGLRVCLRTERSFLPREFDHFAISNVDART
jgi:hypothetical protein